MISVCLLSYNGEKYIEQQIHSILVQLSQGDELIISDDGSTDQTISIIEKINDKRIKLLNNPKHNNPYNGIFRKVYAISRNCENALMHVSGDYIFLSDQDDQWFGDKVCKVMERLKDFDLVLHDCTVVNSDMQPLQSSYFQIIRPRTSFISMLRKSSYMGCCMAFNRKILTKVLPFTTGIVEHDAWIGMGAIKYGSIAIIDESLIYYRRHDNNVSSCAEASPNSIFIKLYRRYLLLKAYLTI